MTMDRHTAAWTKTYDELLKGYVDSLGGKDIAPVRYAVAKQISTLQTELSLLTDRFASTGRGGSSDDIALYLKLSASVSELLASAGLSSQQQPIANQNKIAEETIEKMLAAFDRVRAKRETDEAAGIYCDERGEIIKDPARIEIEKQIAALKKKSADIAAGRTIAEPPPPQQAAAAPAPSAAITPAPVASEPVANVVPLLKVNKVAPPETAEERKRRTSKPNMPPRTADDPTLTPAEKQTLENDARFRAWSATGGDAGSGLLTGSAWSPSSSWRGY